MTVGSSLSSFNAHQNWLNANANNIANVNTNGFVPTDTSIEENGIGEPEAVYSKADAQAGVTQSQTDLTKEMTDQIQSERGFQVNAPVIKTQDEMLGSLLDIVG